MTHEGRNHFIDSLRGLAAMAVCFFHFNEPVDATHTYYGQLVKFGWLGVPVFFAISGYCILISADRSVNAFEFMIRRIFRVFPVYWLSIIIVIGVIIGQKLITGTNSVTQLPTSIGAIIATITLLTKPFSSIPTVNWTYWSLTYELFFYFVVALSLLIPVKYRIYFFIMISLLAFGNFIQFKVFFFLNNWPSFALGMAAYYLLSQKKYGARLILIIILGIINLSSLFYGAGSAQLPEYRIATFTAIVLIILSHFIHSKRSFLSRLGDYSYAVYLIHVPITVYIFGYQKTNSITSHPLHNFIFDLTSYTLINVMAYFIFKYIEMPGIKMGKNLAKNHITNQIPGVGLNK